MKLINADKLLEELETWGGSVEVLHEYIVHSSTAYYIDKESYNKAIDDFVNLINEMPTCYDEVGSIRLMTIEEMAEQLKKGASNDKRKSN